MLIRLDVIPDDLPDEARAVMEARVPGARGKPVPAAGARKACSYRIPCIGPLVRCKGKSRQFLMFLQQGRIVIVAESTPE